MFQFINISFKNLILAEAVGFFLSIGHDLLRVIVDLFCSRFVILSWVPTLFGKVTGIIIIEARLFYCFNSLYFEVGMLQ